MLCTLIDGQAIEGDIPIPVELRRGLAAGDCIDSPGRVIRVSLTPDPSPETDAVLREIIELRARTAAKGINIHCL